MRPVKGEFCCNITASYLLNGSNRRRQLFYAFAFKGYLQYLIRTAAFNAYYASVSEGSVHHTFAYAERGIRRMCRLSGRSKGSRKSDTPCSSLRRCPGKSGRRTPFAPVCSVAGSTVLCTHTLIIAETSFIHASCRARGSAFQ